MDYIVPSVEVLEVTFQTMMAASPGDDLVFGDGGNLDLFEY